MIMLFIHCLAEKEKLAGIDQSEMKKRNDGYLVVDGCKEFLKVCSKYYLSSKEMKNFFFPR